MSEREKRARKLLTWVLDECDLSGQMELDQAIRAWLRGGQSVGMSTSPPVPNFPSVQFKWPGEDVSAGQAPE